jgi:hypothetical protein
MCVCVCVCVCVRDMNIACTKIWASKCEILSYFFQCYLTNEFRNSEFIYEDMSDIYDYYVLNNKVSIILICFITEFLLH